MSTAALRDLPAAGNSGLRCMNILYFVTHPLLPINTGSRLRDYHLSRQLAARATVTFAQMVRAGEKQAAPPPESQLADIASFDRGRAYSATRVIRGLAGPTPVTLLNCWSSAMESQLATMLCSRRFDTVQIQGVHLMQYLPAIHRSPDAPSVVVDWHNIESELMWRYCKTTSNWMKKAAGWRTAKLVERAEHRLLATSAIHIVTSERERQKLLERCPGADIRVVPNGIDTDSFGNNDFAADCPPSGTSILFVGSMDYHANIDGVTWFARTAWPEIARNHPQLNFQIVVRSRSMRASPRIGTHPHLRYRQRSEAFYVPGAVMVVPLRSGQYPPEDSRSDGGRSTRRVHKTGRGGDRSARQCSLGIGGHERGEIVSAVDHLLRSPETRSRVTAAARSLVRAHLWLAEIGQTLL